MKIHQLFQSRFLTILLLIVIISLNGCDDSITDDKRSVNDPFGIMEMYIKDAPVVGAQMVMLRVAQIQLKKSGGDVIDIDVPIENQQVDLVKVQGLGRHELFSGIKIPSGDYEWVKLNPVTGADNSYVVRGDGGQVELQFPQELKIDQPFAMLGAYTSKYIIDVELSKGLIENGSDIELRPAFHFVKFYDDVSPGSSFKTASISGMVGVPYINNCASPSSFLGMVYLFNGDVDPDDMDLNPDSIEPYTTALVSIQKSGYDFGYLPRGQYTIAYTCDVDDPDLDEDTVNFAGKQVILFTDTKSSEQVNFIDI